MHSGYSIFGTVQYSTVQDIHLPSVTDILAQPTSCIYPTSNPLTTQGQGLHSIDVVSDRLDAPPELVPASRPIRNASPTSTIVSPHPFCRGKEQEKEKGMLSLSEALRLPFGYLRALFVAFPIL